MRLTTLRHACDAPGRSHFTRILLDLMRTLTRDGIRFGLLQPILQDAIHDFWLLNC